MGPRTQVERTASETAVLDIYSGWMHADGRRARQAALFDTLMQTGAPMMVADLVATGICRQLTAHDDSAGRKAVRKLLRSLRTSLYAACAVLRPQCGQSVLLVMSAENGPEQRVALEVTGEDPVVDEANRPQWRAVSHTLRRLSEFARDELPSSARLHNLSRLLVVAQRKVGTLLRFHEGGA